MMAYSICTANPEELFTEKIKPLVQRLVGIRREREIACEICATEIKRNSRYLLAPWFIPPLSHVEVQLVENTEDPTHSHIKLYHFDVRSVRIVQLYEAITMLENLKTSSQAAIAMEKMALILSSRKSSPPELANAIRVAVRLRKAS